MAITAERLVEIVNELATRPGHEKIRVLVYELLIHGLGADSSEVDFERPVPEVHGRIDAVLGRTLFEFKRDLRRETGDAEEQLTRYLGQREAETGERFVGIATDGATFVPYELRGGNLRKLSPYVVSPRDARDLLLWLSSAVAVSSDLDPRPEIVRRELGRESITWWRTQANLAALWDELGSRPDVRLKRDLWARLMERVYGSSVDDDTLFLQHTYLSIVAKTMATHVLGFEIPEPADLLSGRRFTEAGITGAVESDFFDWPVETPGGEDLVARIALQAGRFRLRDVETDVLKGLYESLVDPDTRQLLGEYYTPDWLAARICEKAIADPLTQRVLDPACGSGTFLFHAVRRLLSAADESGMSNRDALDLACGQVFGIDIHPVAVQIARVTFLLALGEERLQDRGRLAVPVYMGDALQWDTADMLAEREVLVAVPDEDDLIEFPASVVRDPAVFDAVIDRMLDLSGRGDDPAALVGWLEREHGIDPAAIGILTGTYNLLVRLHEEGRDHIWGFVARNVVRPLWLSQELQRADVVVGNPPWLPYRRMSSDMQERFRDECRERGLWVGGRFATHQDLSGYFFARAVELYLRPDGTIAFVMPYSAMTRRQFEGFRTGVFRRQARRSAPLPASVQFTDAWAFSDDVQPLFPLPSCVLFARSGAPSGGRVLPVAISVVSGTLPRRDATPDEAAAKLTWTEAPWPDTPDDAAPTSVYAELFRNGATIFPRMLCVVERAPAGPMGGDPKAPLVVSRRTPQEKPPWKGLPDRRGNVETQFLRALYLGESITPYRPLSPQLAVIPWDSADDSLLDSRAASDRGYLGLSAWLGDAERLWKQYSRGESSFVQQIDYYGKLSVQFPIPPLRVVFAKSGTLPAAALLDDQSGVIENVLYWAGVRTRDEGEYLLAVLNSETARKRVENQQSRGQWGARDFHKVMLSLPVPRYNQGEPLHRDLSAAAEHAEQIAVAVPLKEGTYFVTARKRIREALLDDGIAAQIDELVARLLDR